MKRPLLGLLVLVSVLASLGASSLAREPDWSRRQEGQRLTSAQAPHLILELSRAYRPLRPLTFQIADLTQAERRIFVQPAPHHGVSRMVIVQFEHALPHSDFRFRFPPRPPETFGGEVWRYGAFSFDQERAAKLAPGKEADRTTAFLKAQGYRVPKDWDVARLARVSDPQGLTEVIIFYMEARKGLPSGTADPEDGSIDATPEQAAALLGRLKAVVKPVEG